MQCVRLAFRGTSTDNLVFIHHHVIIVYVDVAFVLARSCKFSGSQWEHLRNLNVQGHYYSWQRLAVQAKVRNLK